MIAQRRKTKTLIIAASMLLSTSFSLLAGSASGAAAPVPGPIIDGKEGYHVIVTAGEPEGIAAALAAARNGMRVLLVEDDDALGGLMTLGMLNVLDQSFGTDGKLLTKGIFEEFYKALGDGFEIEGAKDWFWEKCRAEPNMTVMLNTEIIAPVMDGNTIIGLEIKKKGDSVSQIVRSLAVIDATVDCDIAVAAGVPYTVGGDDYGAHGILQGITLVFELAGVDWDTVVDHLLNNGIPGTGANSTTAWGYIAEAKSYTPTSRNIRFRGPNIGRQKNGNILLNALILFGVNALNPDSYAEAIATGAREIPLLVDHMRENFVGFENATFVRHATQLYVRETRHIIGEYRLTITDVLENRDHWDRIGHGSYAVDIHATGPDNFGNVIGQPNIYSIPFRCLVPLEIDQLLVTGRSASYDSLPHGSTRTLPVGMVTGEACGTAAAYSVSKGVTFRQMTHDTGAIQWLQDKLKSQGAYLIEYDPPRMAVMDHWAYSGVAVMRELGMTAGGYRNDYALDNEVTNRWALQNKANGIMSLLNDRTAGWGDFRIPELKIILGTDVISVGQLFITAAQCASLGETYTSVIDAGNYLLERGILDANDLKRFPYHNAVATNGQLLYIMGRLYTTLLESIDTTRITYGS